MHFLMAIFGSARPYLSHLYGITCIGNHMDSREDREAYGASWESIGQFLYLTEALPPDRSAKECFVYGITTTPWNWN